MQIPMFQFVGQRYLSFPVITLGGGLCTRWRIRCLPTAEQRSHWRGTWRRRLERRRARHRPRLAEGELALTTLYSASRARMARRATTANYSAENILATALGTGLAVRQQFRAQNLLFEGSNSSCSSSPHSSVFHSSFEDHQVYYYESDGDVTETAPLTRSQSNRTI